MAQDALTQERIEIHGVVELAAIAIDNTILILIALLVARLITHLVAGRALAVADERASGCRTASPHAGDACAERPELGCVLVPRSGTHSYALHERCREVVALAIRMLATHLLDEPWSLRLALMLGFVHLIHAVAATAILVRHAALGGRAVLPTVTEVARLRR